MKYVCYILGIIMCGLSSLFAAPETVHVEVLFCTAAIILIIGGMGLTICDYIDNQKGG